MTRGESQQCFEISMAVYKSEGFVRKWYLAGAPIVSAVAFWKWVKAEKGRRSAERKAGAVIRRKERDRSPAVIARRKEYYSRPEVRAHRQEKHKARLAASPHRKLKRNLRTRLHAIIRRGMAAKWQSASKLCGCTAEELQRYLESNFKRGMSWKNYGKDWHIDHVIPCAKFDLTKLDDQRKCFHYLNLMPEWADVNHSKNCRILQPSQIPLGLAA